MCKINCLNMYFSHFAEAWIVSYSTVKYQIKAMKLWKWALY